MLAWFKGFIKRGVEWGGNVWNRLYRFTFVRFAYNVAQTLGKDYVGIMAAGLAYYAFLSLFPLIVGLISILGFLLPSEEIYEVIFNFLERNVPVSTDFIESNIRSIVNLRGTLGIISIFGLIFGGTAVLSAISLAVNRAWNLWPRPIWIRKPEEFLMVLAIAVMVVLLFGISTGLSILGDQNIPGVGFIQFALSRIAPFILILSVILLLYKFIPSSSIRWRDIWRGAVIAAVMFQLALYGFSFFLNNFGAYELIYGSLASLVVTLIWIYISSFILIIGAEINAVYFNMFIQNKKQP